MHVDVCIHVCGCVWVCVCACAFVHMHVCTCCGCVCDVCVVCVCCVCVLKQATEGLRYRVQPSYTATQTSDWRMGERAAIPRHQAARATSQPRSHPMARNSRAAIRVIRVGIRVRRAAIRVRRAAIRVRRLFAYPTCVRLLALLCDTSGSVYRQLKSAPNGRQLSQYGPKKLSLMRASNRPSSVALGALGPARGPRVNAFLPNRRPCGPAASRRVWPQHIWPRRIWPRHIWPRRVWPRHIWPRRIWPRHIWPRRIWPRHIWPRRRRGRGGGGTSGSVMTTQRLSDDLSTSRSPRARR